MTMMTWKLKQIAKDWAPMITALAALFVAVWQGLESREFYMKTLSPHVSVSLKNTIEKPALLLRSNGTGPAVIREIEIIVDGETYHWHSTDQVDSVMKKLEIDFFAIPQVVNRGDYMPAGSNIELVRVIEPGIPAYPDGFDVNVKVPAHNAIQLGRNVYREKLVNKLSKININVAYESVYGEKYFYTSYQ